VRAALRALALGALAAALAAAGWVLSDVTVASEGGPPRAAVPAPGRPAPLRYRPVGCRARGGAVARFHGPARREVALTFDDGPAPLTLRFVRMLRAQGAVATFFMLGDQVGPRYRGVLREELRDGDALGDHSWSHPNLAASGEVRSQLSGARGAIVTASGYVPCVFRPPYGAFNRNVLEVAHSLGLATIVWDVDPRDWALPGVGSIEATVLRQVKPGSIVLSHDGGGPRGQTLAAYPSIITALRRRGYRFVTVPQLLGYPTIYRACRRDCGEEAIGGRPPAGSIVQGLPRAHAALGPLEPPPLLSR
jgi:peptidoglycan-N-acetylglucosamine deacetylase